MICKIKEYLHPSYQSIVYFTRLLFRSIYIDKQKETGEKTAGVFFLVLLSSRFQLFKHFKTHTVNFTIAPRIACILICRYCVHVH